MGIIDKGTGPVHEFTETTYLDSDGNLTTDPAQGVILAGRKGAKVRVKVLENMGAKLAKPKPAPKPSRTKKSTTKTSDKAATPKSDKKK